ncbi:MAG: glycosyltransferase family 4 protein [Sphingobacteriales bacterium]|nr:MAG: glycosyltransferase family 4 protein [Sphingobacteriales bacterium]
MDNAPKSNYILVLPSWYPSEAHKYSGDFNQRLVEAMSLKVAQIVLYVIAKPNINKHFFTLTTEKGITTYLVYYPLKKSLFGRIFAKLQYFYLCLKFLNLILKKYGEPQLTQVYVFWMAGIFALFLKKIYKIPYVITENWTAFYKDSKTELNNFNSLYKWSFKLILKNSSVIIAVALQLKKQILVWSPKSEIVIIPNVVNSLVFTYKANEKNRNALKLIHVSSMNCHKNIFGLLDAFEMALQTNNNIDLVMVGPVLKPIIERVSSSLVLTSKVTFTGEIPYNYVKNQMQSNNALILFSTHENLPCVILEALCCGLPVITSNVGGCAEVINSTNGIVVESENIAQLSNAILDMALNYNKFNNAKISENACNLFSYNVVGNQVYSVYQSVI